MMSQNYGQYFGTVFANLIEQLVREDEGIPTLTQFRDENPALLAAKKKKEDAMSAGNNRWGDTRRFQGRAAGNRNAAREATSKSYWRIYDNLTKQYNKKYGTHHPLSDDRPS